VAQAAGSRQNGHFWVDESFYFTNCIERTERGQKRPSFRLSSPEGDNVKYFIDTHDRSKGSWPEGEVSEADFLELYARFEKACEDEGGADLGAHVNVAEGKAYCFTKGRDADAIRRAHERVGLAFDSITEVRRVTGVDLRPKGQNPDEGGRR
jgi:hypothetical protein